MTIDFKILGQPGRDNAVLVSINSGQAVHRLLFDCGDGCLNELPFREIQAIDHLFFSHFHIDHVAGFDQFLRCNYAREDRLNNIWGPPNTAEIIHHRFCGFWWNLTEEMRGTWTIHSISESDVESTRLENSEQFKTLHSEGTSPYLSVIYSTEDYSVEAILLDHKGPSVGYLVREPSKTNLQLSRLSELGLKPGPWVRELKEATDPSQTLIVDGRAFAVADLQAKLLVESPGQSIAYVTDFLLDSATHDRLFNWLSGCNILICEAQYRHDDVELAERNYHATTSRVASLAKAAEVDQLILFHLSDRYTVAEWQAMLEESQEIFPETRFPSSWSLD